MDGTQLLPLGAPVWEFFRKWFLGLLTLMCHFPHLKGICLCKDKGVERAHTGIPHILVTDFLSQVMGLNSSEISSKKDPLLHTYRLCSLIHVHTHPHSPHWTGSHMLLSAY